MCIDTLGRTFKWGNTSLFGKNMFKTGKSFRRPPPNVRDQVSHCQMSFQQWPQNQEWTHQPPLNNVLEVADVFVPSFAATSEMTFGGGRHVRCVLCLLFNLRPKLPSRCVVLGSWSIYFFGCCLVNYCGGLIR